MISKFFDNTNRVEVTTSDNSAHGLVLGDFVTVSSNRASINGFQGLVTTNLPNQFEYTVKEGESLTKG